MDSLCDHRRCGLVYRGKPDERRGVLGSRYAIVGPRMLRVNRGKHAQRPDRIRRNRKRLGAQDESSAPDRREVMVDSGAVYRGKPQGPLRLSSPPTPATRAPSIEGRKNVSDRSSPAEIWINAGFEWASSAGCRARVVLVDLSLRRTDPTLASWSLNWQTQKREVGEWADLRIFTSTSPHGTIRRYRIRRELMAAYCTMPILKITLGAKAAEAWQSYSRFDRVLQSLMLCTDGGVVPVGV